MLICLRISTIFQQNRTAVDHNREVPLTPPASNDLLSVHLTVHLTVEVNAVRDNDTTCSWIEKKPEDSSNNALAAWVVGLMVRLYQMDMHLADKSRIFGVPLPGGMHRHKVIYVSACDYIHLHAQRRSSAPIVVVYSLLLITSIELQMHTSSKCCRGLFFNENSPWTICAKPWGCRFEQRFCWLYYIRVYCHY